MPQQEHYDYKEARKILAKARLPKNGKRSSTYRAKRTRCSRNHNHPSKVEARVCESVHSEWDRTPWKVYRNVRLPLWNLPPTDAGLPHYCNVDFVVIGVNGSRPIEYLCDAKLGKRSRDWERGRAAVEATYGLKVVERSQ